MTKRPAVYALMLCAALSPGCRREAAPPKVAVIDARPAPDLAAAPKAALQRPPRPRACEVEIMGEIAIPKGATAPVTVLVALGKDCLAEGARVLGRAPVVSGKFFIEVFAPWGSDLSICAAAESAEGKPTRLYGKAGGAYHAEALGEVTFPGVRIELKRGAPRSFGKVDRLQF